MKKEQCQRLLKFHPSAATTTPSPNYCSPANLIPAGQPRGSKRQRRQATIQRALLNKATIFCPCKLEFLSSQNFN